MLDQEFIPISASLANLANPILGSKGRKILCDIINRQFANLEQGHSCVSIGELADLLAISITDVAKILVDSGLTAEYNLYKSKLAAKPLTILNHTLDQAYSASNLLNSNKNYLKKLPVSSLELNSESLLYITKYLYYELGIANKVNILTQPCKLPNHAQFIQAMEDLRRIGKIHNLPNAEQLQAIENCAKQKMSIITGGPGTGKTTTVTLLLWLLVRNYYGANLSAETAAATPKIKIAAPTGKAANRVLESMKASISYLQSKGLDMDYSILMNLVADAGNFCTIHKLLGYIPYSIYFKHNEIEPLDVDILIVDESSMIGLPLFSKLLNAIDANRTKHIIFLGDKNQLSSVEEGYVFASLVEAKQRAAYQLSYDLFTENNSFLSELIVSNRNQGDVGKLSQAILCQNQELVRFILEKSTTASLSKLSLVNIIQHLFAMKTGALTAYINFMQQISTDSIGIAEIFACYNQQIILCATNIGIFGVNNLNLQIEKYVRRLWGIADIWYTGRPIMILENDYSLGLYNGDIGIAILKKGKIVILFNNGKEYIPEILPKYQIAYAITIHKSQGSEYQKVSVILPADTMNKESNNSISQELLYTAVTRAKISVVIFASLDAVLQAVKNKTFRSSGLKYLF